MERINWGILGAAKIAREQLIPAINLARDSRVLGIASRDAEKAGTLAESLDIDRSYGSYDEMLADPDIHAVYNPLPNHLHVEWTLKALEAGKHVLCEKPFFLSLEEAQQVLDVQRKSGLIVSEAFMVRAHPRWQGIRKLIDEGAVGKLTLIRGHFSYFNDDPENIRYVYRRGGGGLWDIGCYPVHLSRYLVGREPSEVSCRLVMHPEYDVDILATGILDFGKIFCVFSAATQSSPSQHMEIIGTAGRLAVDIPFNPSNDRPVTAKLYHTHDPDDVVEVYDFPAANQFSLLVEAFNGAIRGEREPLVSLADSVQNTRCLLALFESNRLSQAVRI